MRGTVIRISAIQTGSVRIRPSQRAGRMDRPEWVRRMAILADRRWTEPLPIFAYLVEHPDGLILFDSGESGSPPPRWSRAWWHPFFRIAVDFQVARDDEIGPRLRARGIDPHGDITTLVVSHLHGDHADGLTHFRNTRVLVSDENWRAAQGLRGALDGALPRGWPSWLEPERVALTGPAAGPFAASYPVTADGRIFAVPTPGHMRGHMSLVVRDEGITWFLAGDATYDEELVRQDVVDGVSFSVATSRDTLRRIREFARGEPTVLLPAHDPLAAERLAERRVLQPGSGG